METKTSIRPANIHDLPAINDIYNHWVVNSTCTYDDCRSSMDDRKRWFSDHVGGGYPIILAEREGVVLGYGSLSPFRGFRGYRFTVEDSVYVRADAQRQGIGQKLLTELISLARASGMHTMIAVIDSEQIPSLRLHEKNGFSQCARLQQVGFKFDRWLDAIYMELHLTTPPA